MQYEVMNSHAGNGCMNEGKILETIKMLAGSRGFYGRLLESVMEQQDGKNLADNPILAKLAEMNLKDPLDLVFALEC